MTMRVAVAGANLDGFSGTPPHLIAALREHAQVRVWPLPHYRPSLAKRVVVRAGRALGREYLWEKEPARCAFLSRAIDALTESDPVDAVLVLGTESCAFSETKTPLFGFGDSVFGTRIDFYEDQRTDRISARSVREGIDVQQRALDRLRRLFLTSRWAWDRAVQRFGYSYPQQNVRVTLIGANLPHEAVAPPLPAVPRIAWIGVDWKRKRGELAVRTVELLRARGIEVELDIAGVNVAPVAPWMHVHGRLTGPPLGAIYANASLLLLPAAGDLTPVVIAEASMYGRPAFATPVGGIPEMIEDGVTGMLIDSMDAQVWADRIAPALTSGTLHALARNARRAYEDRLNWSGIAHTMVQCMRDAR